MADMKPIGIDQTTGQQRAVEDDDSLVDNLGNQIQLAITNVGDFSSNTRNNTRAVYQWNAPEKITSPGLRYAPSESL